MGSCCWGPLQQHFTPALFILYHTVQQSPLFSPGQPGEQKLLKCKRERVLRRGGLKHPCTSLQIYSGSKFGFQATKVIYLKLSSVGLETGTFIHK